MSNLGGVPPFDPDPELVADLEGNWFAVRAFREHAEQAEREARALMFEDWLMAHLDEVEPAIAEGRLFELVKDAPSVRDQLREFLDDRGI